MNQTFLESFSFTRILRGVQQSENRHVLIGMVLRVEMFRNVDIRISLMFFPLVNLISDISQMFAKSIVYLTRRFSDIQHTASGTNNAIDDARCGACEVAFDVEGAIVVGDKCRAVDVVTSLTKVMIAGKGSRNFG